MNASSRDAKHPTVADLPGMTLAQLRELWPTVMGTRRNSRPPPGPRSLLIRELAWTLQARQHHGALPGAIPGGTDGDLDAHTRRLLEAAVRLATSKRSEKRVVMEPSRPRVGPSTLLDRAATSASLPPMTTLVRVFRGVTHEVLVLEGATPERRRFRFRGRAYRSLSAIAREITGGECSGPRFFGLSTRAAKGGEP